MVTYIKRLYMASGAQYPGMPHPQPQRGGNGCFLCGGHTHMWRVCPLAIEHFRNVLGQQAPQVYYPTPPTPYYAGQPYAPAGFPQMPSYMPGMPGAGYVNVPSPMNGAAGPAMGGTAPFQQGARLRFGDGLQRRSPQRVAAVNTGPPPPQELPDPVDAAYDAMQAAIDEEDESDLNA